MMRYLLVSPDREFGRRVREALALTNGDLRQVGTEFLDEELRGLETVLRGDRQELTVLAIGPGIGFEAALRLARLVDELRPDVNVTLVFDHPDAAMLEEALHAGVREILDPAAPAEELRQVLSRAEATALRRRVALGGDTAGHEQRRVIAVLSPKGGSGKTVVATNLAVLLARRAPGEVVLVDLDLGFGDVSTALGLVPEHDVADAADAVERLDTMAVKVFLTTHASGLNVLCSPQEPEAGERLSPARVAELVHLLSSEFRYVVLDTPSGVSDHTLACLDECSDLVLVSALDVASVRGVRKLRQALDVLGLTLARQHLVLNRAGSRVGLDQDDVEHAIGLDVTAAVPSDRSVPTSMNAGEVLAHAHPRSPIARRIDDLVDHLAITVAEPLRRDRASLLRR